MSEVRGGFFVRPLVDGTPRSLNLYELPVAICSADGKIRNELASSNSSPWMDLLVDWRHQEVMLAFFEKRLHLCLSQVRHGDEPLEFVADLVKATSYSAARVFSDFLARDPGLRGKPEHV
jgi:hypothetical protein